MDDKINEIMDNFDFRKVHEYMQSVGWEWSKPGNHKEMYMPGESELRKVARGLLRDVCKETQDDHVYCLIGGFKAARFGTTLELSFCIADWFAEDE